MSVQNIANGIKLLRFSPNSFDTFPTVFRQALVYAAKKAKERFSMQLLLLSNVSEIKKRQVPAKEIIMADQELPFSQHKTTLSERLAMAHQRRFVGRQEEKHLFQAALDNTQTSFFLLHIYGPGGVGKTTLLRELGLMAQRRKVNVIQLDARNIDPSPAGFMFALRLAMGLAETASPLEMIKHHSKTVLMIDTYETLTPLDSWLRENFLPQLPDTTLVVLAGRNPPTATWRSDPGWRDLIHILSLRNLRPEDCLDYLERWGIATKHHQAVLEFTHGHPLALSLVAEVMAQVADDSGFKPQAAPDIVKTLLERFSQQVPSSKHREALEVCALVRVCTETLLAEAMGLEDSHEYFEWLRGLSFIESGPLGLFPHDLAREALDADLRWRNPDHYSHLHARIRGYYTRKLQETRGPLQQQLLFDDVYLHRHNPMVKPFLEWGQYGSVFPEVAKPENHRDLLAMVTQHEGKAAAQLAAYWFKRQSQSVTVYHDANGVAGFLMMLNLRLAEVADFQRDPATQSVWNYALRYAPPRLNEDVLFFRFWMARDTYQSVSPTQSVIFLNAVQAYLTHANLAWSFFACADADFWLPAFHYMDINRAPEADFTSSGRHFSIFAHDWRAVPVAAWLELLGKRELNLDLRPEDLETVRPEPLLVLSEPAFKEAVRTALRVFNRPSALQLSPLLRSRLVREQVRQDSLAALKNLLLEAAETLKQNPKDEKSYRAILRTYLEPAATQELAAELLDLPFSTYRRHLSSGVDRIVEWLWQQELYN
jgi:hypothetical protein